MADTTNDTRPVDREYLNLRLSELEARTDTKLAQLEARLGRTFLGMFVPLLIAVLGTLVAVIIK